MNLVQEVGFYVGEAPFRVQGKMVSYQDSPLFLYITMQSPAGGALYSVRLTKEDMRDIEVDDFMGFYIDICGMACHTTQGIRDAKIQKITYNAKESV